MRALVVVGYHRGAQLAPVELGIAFGRTKVVVVQQHLVATSRDRLVVWQIRHAVLARIERKIDLGLQQLVLKARAGPLPLLSISGSIFSLLAAENDPLSSVPERSFFST
jgi:hypothetical protein